MVPDIERVLQRHAAEWMSVPGVVGTGIGLDGPTRCITILVVRRTPEIERRIPPEAEGHPVRIVVSGRPMRRG